MRIEWSRQTQADFRRFLDFLDPVNPDAAIRAAQDIRQQVKILIDNPGAGTAIDDGTGDRELYIQSGKHSYVIVEQGQCAGHGHCFSWPSFSLHGQPAEKNGALQGVNGLPVSEQAVQATGSRQNRSHNYWARKMAVKPSLKVSQARPDAVALIQCFGSVRYLNFYLLFNDVP